MSLSPDQLHKFLRYEPKTGKLFWRTRPLDMFEDGKKLSAVVKCRWWNTRYAGKEAFTASSHGYKVGAIWNKLYRAHRVIWAMIYGRWPKNEIDHIDHDPINNVIENLREVTHKENGRNQKRPSNNKSGHVGVRWQKQTETWSAEIMVDNKNISLGCFACIDDAVIARQASEMKHNFHKNHGNAANLK